MDDNRKFGLFHLIVICLVSITTSYDLGQTYHYKYVTGVNGNQLLSTTSSKPVTFEIQADVAATNVWHNAINENDYLLLLKISGTQLLLAPKGDNSGELKFHHSSLDNYADEIVVVHLVDGLIVGLYANNEKSDFLNLKAGIAGLFQVHLKPTERDETDSSGKCRVVYSVSGNNVHKRKTNCTSPFKDLYRTHPHPVCRAAYNSEVSSKYEITKDSTISLIDSTETHTYEAVMLKTAGTNIKSRQKLQLIDKSDGHELIFKKPSVKDVIKGLSKIAGSVLSKTNFHVPNTASKPGEQCKEFVDILKKRRNAFRTSNLAKYSSVATFNHVLQYSHDCNKASIEKILKDSKNNEIVPQLLDVFAATATTSSMEAVLDYLKIESATSIDLAERYLTSLSTLAYPQRDLIQRLLTLLSKKFHNQKLYETLLLTVGSLIKSYHVNADNANDETTEQFIKFFTIKLKECKDHLCKLPYLRGLQQAGLANSIHTLLDVINDGGKAVPEAILALRSLSKTSLTDEAKSVLQDVFFQLKMKHDPSARTLAADLLLQLNPSVELLSDIVSTFNKSVTHEMATYILSKIKDIATRDLAFRNKWLSVLKDPLKRNYHILGQTGFSVAEIHDVPEIPYVNASYEVIAEFLKAGTFKRSVFGASYSINEDTFHLLNFGTFAGGLSSWSDSSQAEDGDDEELTAGLQLNVLGAAVRPYTLFTGQAEVMSLLWSGAGSETTPIFQAIMKLHDNRHVLSLQNGLKLELSLLSAASIDISGSVQVSIWSRNSQSQVTNGFSFLLKSFAHIETDFIDAKVDVSTAADLALEFVTDSDFSGKPLKSCMVFGHNPFQIKQLVSKLEKVPGSARKLRRNNRLKYKVPGRCFALNRRICEMCSEMSSK
ncbi:hypothetical protein CHUAL_003932 [Chamberlinius hualienensis]